MLAVSLSVSSLFYRHCHLSHVDCVVILLCSMSSIEALQLDAALAKRHATERKILAESRTSVEDAINEAKHAERLDDYMRNRDKLATEQWSSVGTAVVAQRLAAEAEAFQREESQHNLGIVMLQAKIDTMSERLDAEAKKSSIAKAATAIGATLGFREPPPSYEALMVLERQLRELEMKKSTFCDHHANRLGVYFELAADFRKMVVATPVTESIHFPVR
jgi:hypothetical protein